MEQDSILVSKKNVNSSELQQETADDQSESDPTLRPWSAAALASMFVPIEHTDSPYRDRILVLPQERRWLPHTLRNYRGFWELEGAYPHIMALQDHFEPRPSDVLVASSPKCGTTWLKAVVFSVVHRNKYDFASHPLLRLNPHDCVKFLEVVYSDEGKVYLESLPSPRVLGTHLAYSLLPDSVRSSNCKILYICRDPKDALVSFWHMNKALLSDDTLFPFSEAFELFCDGRSLAGPIWDNMLSYWHESLERPDKVLFLRYKEMLADPLASVKRIADFVGHPFTKEEEMEGVGRKIVDLCSFGKLTSLEVNKKREGGGPSDINHIYFRKGLTGDWKNHMTPAMAERLDAITRLKLQRSGLVV